MPIRTQQARIPWSWAFLIGLPWVTVGLADRVSAEPLTFTLRRFIDDPAVLSFVASINVLFNFMVGVVAAYLSDRIWTSSGRRKPFFIAGALGCAAALAVLPVLGNLAAVLVVVVLYQFCVDLNKVWEPLFNEVLPPAQRGRGGVFRMLSVNTGLLLFSGVLLAQYDAEYGVLPVVGPVRGEHVLYWVVAVVMVVTAAFLKWGVVEEKPPEVEGSRQVRTRVPGVWWTGGGGGGVRAEVAGAVRGMFADRQHLWVYVLYACPVISGAALGNPSNTLMYTEQLGMTKAAYGQVQAVAMVAMVVVFTPFAGWLADRMGRLRLMRLGLTLPAVVQLVLFLHLRARGGEPLETAWVAAYVIATNLFQSWLWAVWGPIVFDYVPPRRMGACQAGILFTAGILGFVLTNAGGLWVRWWSPAAAAGEPGATYDHSGILVLNGILAFMSVLPTVAFRWAEIRGQVQPLGRTDRPVTHEPQPS